MTQTFQIGDVVYVREHTEEEQDRYIHGWTFSMDEFETKQCIVVGVEQTRCDGIAYSLVQLKPGCTVTPGVSRRDVQDPTSNSFAFAPDSLTMVQLSPWRDVVLGGRHIPTIGDNVPDGSNYYGKTVTHIMWTGLGVYINEVLTEAPTIPKPAFTTF